MISVSKLLCERGAEGDGLRYDAAHETDAEQIRERKQRHPVVVWNATRRCNLRCRHCYASADSEAAAGELTTREARTLIDELAEYGVPVLLFSGGESLVRDDLNGLVAHAADRGIRPVLSTNGTLLSEDRARRLKRAGLAYAGVSVDGLPERNDAFRGREGAFESAVEGIAAAQAAGLKTGLRYTVTEANVEDLPGVVDLLTDRGVDRFCFYHLDYGGRGESAREVDLSPPKRRRVVRRLCELTREYHANSHEIETLLVGNYADTAFLVEYAREAFGDERAASIRRYLERNGGDPAGERVADIDPQGNVHPTQFWQGYSLGNVRDRPFGAIWEDGSNPLLSRLRERPATLSGRCLSCRYRDICRGGSRLRALTVHGELSAPDPQCYLTPDERGVSAGDAGFGAG
jgi:pseudo-rSAM protein/SPASM domain protein